MKILIIHNSYREKGGEDELVSAERKLLIDAGHEVFTYERSNREIDSFSFFRKAKFLVRDLRWSKETYRQARSLVRKEKPDIAHVYNIFYLISPSIYDAFKDSGIPVVQSLYNYRFFCLNGLLFRNNKICEDCLGGSFWPGIAHRCNRGLLLTSLALSRVLTYHFKRRTFQDKIDAFIVSSEFAKRKMAQAGLPIEKIVVKPHFINPIGAESDGGQDYALFVGRLVDYKGVDTLISAFRKYGNFKLKLIGLGPLYERLKKETVDCKNIELLGRLPDDKFFELLRKASFLVCPSQCYENTPRVVIESFSSGIPVIASDIGSMRELIKDGSTGLLFPPGNSAELIDRIRTLAENKVLASAMGRNALKEYRSMYTSESNYRKLMSIYEPLVTKSSLNN